MLQWKNLFLLLLLIGFVNGEGYLAVNDIFESIPDEKKQIIQEAMNEFGKVVTIEICKLIIPDYGESCKDIIAIYYISRAGNLAPGRITNRNNTDTTNSTDNNNKTDLLKKLREFLIKNKIFPFSRRQRSKREIEIFLRKIMRLL